MRGSWKRRGRRETFLLPETLKLSSMNPPCGRCSKAVYPTEKINCLDKKSSQRKSLRTLWTCLLSGPVFSLDLSSVWTCWTCLLSGPVGPVFCLDLSSVWTCWTCLLSGPVGPVSCLDLSPVWTCLLSSCLQFWHKGCFSCEVCKMALSMSNYKGFDKKPYCTMHYPKTSFTIVTDTPENLRLKQQTLLNSQALYKEDFERNKGRGFSVVADTPEMARLKKTQDQISNIKYHEDFEKSKIRSDAPPPENRQDDDRKPAHPERSSQPLQPGPTAPPAGGRFQAVFGYAAAEPDEVSLQEGDLILEVEPIAEGWVLGRSQRTGQRGLLPANYIRPL